MTCCKGRSTASTRRSRRREDRKFVLLYKELDADDEELTRTRKVRRSFVEARYAGIIAGLYGDEQKIAVDTTIRYQDGRTARSRRTSRA